MIVFYDIIEKMQMYIRTECKTINATKDKINQT